MLKVEADVLARAEETPQLRTITDKMNWQVLKAWVDSCSALVSANKRSQQTRKPNIQQVILGSIKLLIAANKLANPILNDVHEEIVN